MHTLSLKCIYYPQNAYIIPKMHILALSSTRNISLNCIHYPRFGVEISTNCIYYPRFEESSKYFQTAAPRIGAGKVLH